jgi:hypothetical protein
MDQRNVDYIALQPKHVDRRRDEYDATSRLTEDTAYSHDQNYDPQHHASPQQSWTSKFASGSLQGVLWVTILTTVITLINLILTVMLMISYPMEAGIGDALVGSCSEVASWSRWLHIGINILSSGLLGASNYCMQRLCAPTRAEIDREHARGGWLDIGLPSVRSFRTISRGRKVLWILLGLSSVPLHLL